MYHNSNITYLVSFNSINCPISDTCIYACMPLHGEQGLLNSCGCDQGSWRLDIHTFKVVKKSNPRIQCLAAWVASLRICLQKFLTKLVFFFFEYILMCNNVGHKLITSKTCAEYNYIAQHKTSAFFMHTSFQLQHNLFKNRSVAYASISVESHSCFTSD